jgi:hypothetical protein
MDRNDINKTVELFKEDFEREFPGHNALEILSSFCELLIRIKMQKYLETSFGFMSPPELHNVLEVIHEQKTKEVVRRPGRPRKPRDNGPNVRLITPVDAQEEQSAPKGSA